MLRSPRSPALRRVASTLTLPVLAVVCLLSGLLPAADAEAVLGRVGPILAFLAAVTVLAELSDDAGLFEQAAAVAARAGRGRVLALWLLVVVLAVLTTTLLSLDTTAVLLTPVVLTLASALDLPALPFAMTTVCLANTGSLLLPVANLTNLLAVERLHWTAATWAAREWPAALVAVLVTVAVLALVHRRDLRGRYPVRPRPPVGDAVLVAVAAVCCVGLGLAVSLGAPPWAAAGVGAVALVLAFAVRRPRALGLDGVDGWLRLLPWRLVLSTVSIFLVVATVQRHGLEGLLTRLAGHGGQGSVLDALRSAGVGALGSNVLNNLPAYLAVEPAVAADHLRLLALVVGTNVGPLVTVWASLATLLWRERCRAKGLEVSALRFGVQGLAVALPALLLSALTLALTTR